MVGCGLIFSDCTDNCAERLRGEACQLQQMTGPRKAGPKGIWWRWWESNPRPQALCSKVYMLIPSLVLLWATRRAGKTHSQFSADLTGQTLNKPSPRSCEVDPWDPDAQARAGQRALGWFLSS